MKKNLALFPAFSWSGPVPHLEKLNSWSKHRTVTSRRNSIAFLYFSREQRLRKLEHPALEIAWGRHQGALIPSLVSCT